MFMSFHFWISDCGYLWYITHIFDSFSTCLIKSTLKIFLSIVLSSCHVSYQMWYLYMISVDARLLLFGKEIFINIPVFWLTLSKKGLSKWILLQATHKYSQWFGSLRPLNFLVWLLDNSIVWTLLFDLV